MAFIGLTREAFDKLDEALGKIDDIDTYVSTAVSQWIEDHPEAVTTVQDDSITPAKLNESVALTSEELAAILV